MANPVPDDDKRFNLDDLLAEASRDGNAEIAACRKLRLEDIRTLIERHVYPAPTGSLQTVPEGQPHA